MDRSALLKGPEIILKGESYPESSHMRIESESDGLNKLDTRQDSFDVAPEDLHGVASKINSWPQCGLYHSGPTFNKIKPQH